MKKIRAEILKHAREGSLLDLIFRQYGRRWLEKGDPTLTALAGLHNAGEIDVVGAVTPSAISGYKGVGFFGGQQVYRSLISRLDAPAGALLNLVQTLVEAAGQDLAAGLPVEDFAEWCSLDASRPAELLSLVDAKFPNADRFLTIAIKYGVKVDRDHFLNRAYEYLSSGSDVEKQSSIYALGQIELPDEADWRRWLRAFARLVADGQGDPVYAAVLNAVGRRLNGAPAEYENELVELGVEVVATLGDYVLDTAARLIAFDLEHLPERLLDRILNALANLNPQNLGTLETVDFALMKLLEVHHVQRARLLIESLIELGIDPEKFDSFWHKLREIGGQVQNDWIVAWLLNGDYALCKALDDALFQAGADEVSLRMDFTAFSMTPLDYPYLARKAIASFFLKPQLMTSVLLSLLRSVSQDQSDAVVQLLIDPILINYSGVGREIVRRAAEDDADPAQVHAVRALEGLETYIEGLRSVGNVPELHPSERERTIEWQRHADSMAEAFRNARKKSIFASIVTESVLLYGTRSVSWVEQPAEDKRRIETPLGTISHSFEVPRVDVVDPLGLQLMLIRFRSERRPR